MSSQIPETLKKYLYWNQSIALADVQRLLGLGKTQSNQYFIKFKKYLQAKLVKNGHGYHIAKELPFSYSVNSLLQELLIWKKNNNSKYFYYQCKNLYIDPLYTPKLNDEAVKKVLSALNQNQAIEIGYVDAKLGASEELRNIRPLALCFINERWHVHAYCFKREDVRDFVLSRINSAGNPFKLKFPGLADSIQDMQKLISIKIAPHPKLTADQKLTVEREYKIQGGTRVIRIPKHQYFYFKKKYLAINQEAPPEKFLIEKNR